MGNCSCCRIIANHEKMREREEALLMALDNAIEHAKPEWLNSLAEELLGDGASFEDMCRMFEVDVSYIPVFYVLQQDKDSEELLSQVFYAYQKILDVLQEKLEALLPVKAYLKENILDYFSSIKEVCHYIPNHGYKQQAKTQEMELKLLQIQEMDVSRLLMMFLCNSLETANKAKHWLLRS